jgi:hypothetical protein
MSARNLQSTPKDSEHWMKKMKTQICLTALEGGGGGEARKRKGEEKKGK